MFFIGIQHSCTSFDSSWKVLSKFFSHQFDWTECSAAKSRKSTESAKEGFGFREFAAKLTFWFVWVQNQKCWDFQELSNGVKQVDILTLQNLQNNIWKCCAVSSTSGAEVSAKSGFGFREFAAKLTSWFVWAQKKNVELFKSYRMV